VIGTAALLMPAVASARPGYELQTRRLELQLSTRTAGGWRVSVTTLGHRRVTLAAVRGNVSARYTTSGTVSRNRIAASFGSVGAISVRFHGARRPFNPFPGAGRQRPRHCHGRAPVREVGVFRGGIRFAGERGFARLHARRAHGEVRRFYQRLCRREGRRSGRGARVSARRGARVNLLVATDPSPRRTVRLEDLSFDFGPGLEEVSAAFGSLAEATITERREGIRIVRQATANGGEGSLLLSRLGDKPETATATPPKPLRGRADYAKEAGSAATWHGSLRAWLPGAGTVPLTGRGFSASLCRVPIPRFTPANRCLRESGAALPAPFKVGTGITAQMSGSQSQLFGDARLSWAR
jgi:hypothetical protein